MSNRAVSPSWAEANQADFRQRWSAWQERVRDLNASVQMGPVPENAFDPDVLYGPEA